MSHSAVSHTSVLKDNHTQATLQTMLDTVYALFTKHEGSEQENDLLALFSDKIPMFVERSLRDIEAKRNNKSLIEDCVNELYM